VDNAPWSARPSYYFNNMWDFLNDAPSAENASFDPLTGMPTDFRKDTRQTLAGIFIQDDYRLRPNLTLTLGLRWSYFGSISENSDDLSSVVLGDGNAALTGLSLRLGGKLYDVSKTDFGPQVSFAWSPSRFNERLVFRGGAGIAYNGLDQAISLNGRGNAPFLSTAGNLTGSQIVYGVGSFPADVNSFSGYASNPATIATFDPNTNLPVPGGPNFAQISLTGYPAEWPTTRAVQYSLEAEYDLGNQWVASLGYQGSTTRHLTIQRNLNRVLAAQGVPLNPIVNNLEYYSNDGNAEFNALLAGIRHRFSNSFELVGQYRLSRSMDDGSNNFAQDAYSYDPEEAWGPSDYDATHMFKLWGVWSPTIFKNGGWLEKTLGGWTISGIFNAHSGFPWTPVYSGLGCGVIYAGSSGNCDLRPAAYLGGALEEFGDDAFKRPGGNFPGGGSVFFTPPSRVEGPPFDLIASGAVPAGPVPGRPGISRNSFRGPRYFNIDATLSKGFGLPGAPVLGNAAKVEFRANFFNLFNQVNLFNVQNNINDSHFGEAQDGLAGRTIEMQVRFSF